jgi:thiol-disulfide isomerase/thioredoxin
MKPSRRRLLTYLGWGTAGVATAVGAAQILARSQTWPQKWPQSDQAEDQSVYSSARAANSDSPSYSQGNLPEFMGIANWLNSQPLSITDLQGSVTLIQFWTFACINCQRTLPYIVRWHQDYANRGLKVIGIHTPEFSFEREVNQVERALKQHGITYPVPLDNDYKTWSAYQNQYWPHLFLADRQGVIQYDHIGEGAYSETEQKIQQLLG